MNDRKGMKINRFVILLVLIWTGMAAASLWLNANRHRKEIMQTVSIQADLTLAKDMQYWRWSSSQGGIYVAATAKTPPNPHLNVSGRDLETVSGQALTLMHPAYLIRQVNEITDKDSKFQGHITSLHPMRPGNSPDPWEKNALQTFERGTKEISGISKIGGQDYFRLMRPFVTEESCLKCHVSQGYRVGDILGGISVSILMKPFYALMKAGEKRLFLNHGIIWVFFSMLIVWGGRRLKIVQDSLKKSEDRFRELFENMRSGVAVYEATDDGNDFVFRNFNRSAENIDRTSKAAVIGRSILNVFPSVKEFGLFEVLQNVWRDGAPRHHPICRYRDGRIEGWRENYVYKLPSGELVAIYDDVTESKRREEEIRILAVTDSLTGLYNRRGFMTLAEQQIKTAARTNNRLSLMFVDIDGMKRINDTWGHEEGDRALIAAATILKQTFRESDIVARMGGDEFAVLAVDAAEKPETILSRLENRIDLHNAGPDSLYRISMSIGTAVYDPRHPCSLDELISRADTLMYEQKRMKFHP